MDRRKSALSVKSELKTELILTISESTIRRRLYEVGFNGRIAHEKRYVSKNNRVKHLHYTQKRTSKSHLDTGTKFFGRMKQSSTCLDRMGR